VVKRSLLAVALFLGLISGGIITAQPAAASVTNCGPYAEETHGTGTLRIRSCVRHTAGAYYSWGEYYCYFNQAGTRVYQWCNIGATQTLWYNATPVELDDVSRLGLETHESVIGLSGSPHGCTTAQISTSIRDVRVRFANDRDNVYPLQVTAASGVASGSLSC